MQLLCRNTSVPSSTTGETREPHLAVITPTANQADAGRQTTKVGWKVTEGKRQAVLEEEKDKTMGTYTELNKPPH